MQLPHITKQLSGDRGLDKKAVSFLLVTAAATGEGEGLMDHGAPRCFCPSFQELLSKKGAAQRDSNLLLHHRGSASIHWPHMQLRVENVCVELLSAEAAQLLRNNDA